VQQDDAVADAANEVADYLTGDEVYANPEQYFSFRSSNLFNLDELKPHINGPFSVIWLRDENGYKAKKQSYWPLDVEWD
jgi:hypothetical protein